MTAVTVGSAADLQALLRDRDGSGPRVHLRGRGTRARLSPAQRRDVLEVSLRELNSIERLEPDDLTCSLQPGVPCRELAAELAGKGLEVGGLDPDGTQVGPHDRADDGSIGGLIATDPLGPPNPGSPCPRSTLLGLDAVLGCGTEFRSGARVVKSVAGFDVHRLFVGSRGQLFAATLLHLKLRPLPRARAVFATAADELEPMLTKFLELLRQPPPPRRLVLRRDGAGFGIDGVFAGRATEVATLLRRHGLREVEYRAGDHLGEPAIDGERRDLELVVGRLRPSRIAALIAALPADAPFLVHGGGHFEATLPRAATDRLLVALPALLAHGAIAHGIDGRRGRGTPLDPGAERLQRALRSALDPGEVLL